MEEQKTYTLVASSNSGRYALDDPEHGQDLTSGQSLAILVGAQWIEGRVEHNGMVYAAGYGGGNRPKAGYVFLDQYGHVCGLCVGMRVKLP